MNFGFKNPWFKAVLNLGWNYIGRLSGSVHYDDGTGFKPLSELFQYATSTPQEIGSAVVAKTNPLATTLYLYHKPAQGRKHRTKAGKIITNKQSRKHAKSNREPWILASSLPHTQAKLIIQYYKLRMTIEESFRDVKSQRYGLSFNEGVPIDELRKKGIFVSPIKILESSSNFNLQFFSPLTMPQHNNTTSEFNKTPITLNMISVSAFVKIA